MHASQNTKRRFLIASIFVLLFLAFAGRTPDVNTFAALEQDEDEIFIFLPSLWKAVESEDLAAEKTALPPTATNTPIPDTPTTAPTLTALPSHTPTVPSDTGIIHGRITNDGMPMAEGYGAEGLPQIELRRKESSEGDWEIVSNAIIEGDQGAFKFENPPPLAAGQVYQVRWYNPTEVGIDFFLNQWWSRDINGFGDGSDVDVGIFEVADLKYKDPCNDCGRSAPIEFEWTARKHRSDKYRWAMFPECGDIENRWKRRYLSSDLGRSRQLRNRPASWLRFQRAILLVHPHR